MGGWSISLLVLGALTIILGIFMLTLQVCTAAIVAPDGEAICIASFPAFLFSGSMTVFFGGMMLVWGVAVRNE
ncbi:MAG: hypothetical protein ACE5EW_04555 [Thermoplasmata archaeon]